MLRRIQAKRQLRWAAALSMALGFGGAQAPADAGEGQGCPGGVCPVNSRYYGYFPTKWRRWPGTEPQPEPPPTRPTDPNVPTVQLPKATEELDKGKEGAEGSAKSPSATAPPAAESPAQDMKGPPPGGPAPGGAAPGAFEPLPDLMNQQFTESTPPSHSQYFSKPASLEFAESKNRRTADASRADEFNRAGNDLATPRTIYALPTSSEVKFSQATTPQRVGRTADSTTNAGPNWQQSNEPTLSPRDGARGTTDKSSFDWQTPAADSPVPRSSFASAKPSLVDRLSAASRTDVTGLRPAGNRHLPFMPSTATNTSPSNNVPAAEPALTRATPSRRWDSPPPSLASSTSVELGAAGLQTPNEAGAQQLAPPTRVSGIDVPQAPGAGQKMQYKAIDEAGPHAVANINPLEISSSLLDERPAIQPKAAATSRFTAANDAASAPAAKLTEDRGFSGSRLAVDRIADRGPAQLPPIGRNIAATQQAPVNTFSGNPTPRFSDDRLSISVANARLALGAGASVSKPAPSNFPPLTLAAAPTPLPFAAGATRSAAGADSRGLPQTQSGLTKFDSYVAPPLNSQRGKTQFDIASPPTGESRTTSSISIDAPTDSWKAPETNLAARLRSASPTVVAAKQKPVAASQVLSFPSPNPKASLSAAATQASTSSPAEAATVSDESPNPSVTPATYRVPLASSPTTLAASSKGFRDNNPLRAGAGKPRELNRNEFSAADWSEMPSAPASPAGIGNPLRGN